MRAAVTIGLTILTLTGCGSGATGDRPPGTVHGQIIGVGGPAGTADHSIPATVVVAQSGRTVSSQDVAENAEFRFSLKPGRYRLTVTGIGAACESADVTVTSAAEVTRDLTCQLK